MKQSLLLLFLLSFIAAVHAQHVGIGTKNPAQKLDVNGAIRIGNTASPVAGTIRYNEHKQDFEGYTGTAWVSLTGGKHTWGDRTNYSYENATSDIVLFYNTASGTIGSGLGKSITTQGNYMIAGAYADYSEPGIGLAGAGTVRVFYKSSFGWKILQAVTSPFPAINESFGYSVSLDNDYFVVGSPGNNSSRGRVYIFRFNEGGPEYLNNFTPGDVAVGDRFGHSVAISGNTVIVGSNMKKVGNNSEQGRASIYTRNTSTNAWQHVAHLYAPDGRTLDHFGENVAINGSVAAVTSRIYALEDSGAVYLYRFSNGTWTPDTVLTGHSGKERFGGALFLKGDTLVVGAPGLTNSTADSGKVYVYIRQNNVWHQQAIIAPDDSQDDDNFGSSVWLENGYLAVGARLANVRLYPYAGKAYIFRLSGGMWHQQATLVSSNAQANAKFGLQVALNGNTCFVGAPGEEVDGKSDHGRVYYYYR